MAINQSNLPTQRRFKFEDFPGAEQWFANFLSSLNLFIDPVYQILDGGIGYQNLIIPRNYTVTITSAASGATTFNFVNPLRIVPSSVLLGNIYEEGSPSIHPTSAVTVFWHFSQGTIYIDDVIGLDSSTTYVITLTIL